MIVLKKAFLTEEVYCLFSRGGFFGQIIPKFRDLSHFSQRALLELLLDLMSNFALSYIFFLKE